jgi:ribonuclease D
LPDPGLDISGLGPLLADPGILKVLHGAEYDVAVLHRDFGFTIANLFDTMWASRILGWPDHGLGDLLESRFGVHLNKKYQRANWGLRPLPPEQLDYARLDTHYLLDLYDLQAQELANCKRYSQAEHHFSRLVKTRWEAKGFDPEGFWRLPGIRDLDDAGRGVLRELYLYRDQRARSENRPAFKVLSNKAMIGLAETRPSSASYLHLVKGISHRMANKYGRALLAAIQRGTEHPLPWNERPRQANNGRAAANGRPSAETQARFEALRAWRNATAEARGVEPDIVLTNQTLWAVAHRNPRNHADLTRDDLLARWQADEFGRDLLAVVRSAR